MTLSKDQIEGAFQSRWDTFGDTIFFFAPGLKRYETSELAQNRPNQFVPVSVTGRHCALNCDHCQGQLLHSMRDVGPARSLFELCRDLKEAGAEGVLVSGGADGRGRVPLLPHLNDLRRIKQYLGLRVLVHTGLVDDELARGLRTARVDGAMIDIIGSDETIREVYHLEATVADYERSMALLSQYNVNAMPHIVLGLHYGQWRGEETALSIVSRHAVHALVLVVINPLDGTQMAGVAPPSLEELGEFFLRARLDLPRTPLLLGCARPAGEMKAQLDRLAVDMGFNGIAYPVDGLVEYASTKGLTAHFSETCCALLPF